MAEYIDREKLIPDRCYYEPEGYEAVSIDQIFHEDIANVIEREKIDKAREQMLDSKFHGKTVLTYNDAINDCVKILDKLMEREVEG